MKLNLYTIYDTAAAYYKNPWCAQTDEQAMREFTDIFDGDNPIARHPEHYYLQYLGTFNTDTGKIIQDQARVKTLLTGLEALAIKNIDNNEINDSVDDLTKKRMETWGQIQEAHKESN